ncbi:integrase arm-type DNA-binding domain-containing protein [Sphingomonas sp. TREG-RG-20F-R18-01]|uniref:tyrosine-type recombinase/integrase n=1 Tax=Sphingomonas sp. TREG-RG-20F-R18-01 TaxID=2914982 RepID=UPI001F5A3DAC|nr:integrase arm-type DNA-binding domain-containing protein [Sphingomonas sp. TREG-RG-20F-R18-01]
MLTEIVCRNAKPRDKAYKLADEKGLYLFVTTTGFRSWRMKYRFGLVEKRLTIGPYPEVTLREARDARDEARKLLRADIDPAIARKQRQAASVISAGNTLEMLARAWVTDQASGWTERYATKSLQSLELNVFPSLGSVPISDVTVPMVLQTLRAMESRGAIETAHRVRQHLSAIFLVAIGAGLATNDPAHVVKAALQPMQHGRRPAARALEVARGHMRRIEGAAAYPATLLASRLLALTAARPGIVLLAEVSEFEGLDGEKPIWRVPATKMKLTRQRKLDADFEFVMPLAKQAVAVVRAAMMLGKPDRQYLFPGISRHSRPLSSNTLGKHYRDAGLQGKHVPHGWRSTFSTIMNELAAVEERSGDRQIIDMMLAHMQEGVEAIYNRAAYMPRRRQLSQEWADMLMAGLVEPAQLYRDAAPPPRGRPPSS